MHQCMKPIKTPHPIVWSAVQGVRLKADGGNLLAQFPVNPATQRT